jgi:glycine dehydrogenase subunit 2
MSELIFEKKSRNDAAWLPAVTSKDDEEILKNIPLSLRRKGNAGLPSVSEFDVVRHFTALSQKNFCVDANFYPLGSCTMKYNPKVLDWVASQEPFLSAHPYADESQVQGSLKVLYDTQRYLSEITGMDEFTLQPAAGAHGEFCGLLLVGAYHRARKQKKTKVLVPDSSHGTNPASAMLAGYEIVQVRTDLKGHVDLEDLRSKLDSSTACLMLTNPNTLGIFEEQILEIARLVHAVGGLVYYDGANMNALLGICRPGDMGFDVVHINLHKTFAVPHGSGGPGSGPVGVKKELVPFLPAPRVLFDSARGYYSFEKEAPHSIGKLRSFYGNFGAILRAYAYLLLVGREGMREIAENAILNANYLKAKLKAFYDVPFDGYCMHEFVASARRQKAKGVKALDIAKRLLDFKIHAPTIYFPMIVEEALMIEPTETESKATLDRFIEVMIAIEREIDQDPKKVLEAPHTTPVRRIDEVRAARELNLRYRHKDCHPRNL